MRYRINTFIFMLLSFVTILSISSCEKAEQKKPANYPESLILLPNATNVKYYEVGGSLQLTYKLKVDYPAAKVIEVISNKLKQDKWHILKEDFLNPGFSSSHVSGWSSYENATKSPTQIDHLWKADWENQSGDIVTYAFLYQYGKKESKDLNNLTVYGIFISAPLAKQSRAEIAELMEKGNQGKNR